MAFQIATMLLLPLALVFISVTQGIPQQNFNTADWGKQEFTADIHQSNASPVHRNRGIYYLIGSRSRYMVNSTGESTQQFGATTCASLGATLVSIETREEDEEISALLPNADFEYWTSGTFSTATRRYLWVATGQYLVYTNWDPSYYDEIAGYAVTKHGRRDILNKWHTHPANTIYSNVGFICEFPLEASTTTTEAVTTPEATSTTAEEYTTPESISTTVEEYTTPEPTTTTTTTTLAPSTTTTTTLRTTTQGGGGCGNFQCPSPEGHFPDPDDCAAFYSCVGGLCVGHQVCPDGLLFNPVTQQCDYPSEVVCPSKLV